MQQNQPLPPPTNPSLGKDPTYLEAPLVHLVDTDPKTLNPEQLRGYLETLRVYRGNAATVKAATRRGSVSSGQAKGSIDLEGLL